MKSPAKKPPTKAAATKKPTAKKPTTKTAATKKAPSKKSAPTPVPAPLDASATVYTLFELVRTYGQATEQEVFTYVDRDRQALIDDGSEVATPRIDTDAARIYGRAGDFWKSANPEQKRALRGFSADLTRVAIWAARHGQELYEQWRLADSQGAASQEKRQEEARSLRQKAVARREQLRTLLRLAVGGNEQHEADIGRAYGRIAKPEQLAQSLAELTKLAEKYLTSSDPALKQRTVAAGLDAPYLSESAALAATLSDQLKTATASREAPVVSQADIDLWDGVNLYLLERIIDLFEVANQLEPTVPRLLPLSLRSWFKPIPRKTQPPAPAPTQPTT